MSEPTFFASPGPLLLARKGLAKPVTRAELGAGELTSSGENGAGSRGDKVTIPKAPSDPAKTGPDQFKDAKTLRAEPEVKRQQNALIHRIADANMAAAQANGTSPTSLTPAHNPPVQRRTATEQGRRAAFTLRLDETRHLKLKLAATVYGESAQQIVTRALDQFLADMPETTLIAAQVMRDRSKA